MSYFVFIANEKIIGKGRCACNGMGITNIPIDSGTYDRLEKYSYKNGKLTLNYRYKKKVAELKKAQFNKEFFKTSLGYVKRKVTLVNGETKDFLTDLLPSISLGVQYNKPINITVYEEPIFDDTEINWEELQSIQPATSEFIQECLQQFSEDFLYST
jgi:hypothetical protein